MSQDICQQIIGLSEEEARKLLSEANMKARISKKDGKPFVGIRDFRTDRVNLTIENGKITQADIG